MIPDIAPRGDARLAHGQVRGLYDVAARPGSDELWVAHVMLGTDTAAARSRLRVAPCSRRCRSLRAERRVPRDAVDRRAGRRRASTARSATSCRARTRSRSRSDGALALVVDTNSEDVLAIDAARRGRGRAAAPAARPHARGHRAVARRHASRTSTSATPATSRSCDVDAHRAVTSRSPSTARDPAARRRSDAGGAALRPAPVLLGEQRRVSDHEEPLGRVRELPHRGPQRRGDVAVRAGPARHADERRRHARHRLSVPHRRSQPRRRTTGTRSTSSRAARSIRSTRRRCSTRSTDYVNHGIPLPVPPTTDPALVARGAAIFERPTSAARAATAARASPTPAPATRRSISRAPSCCTTSARA